MNDLSNGPIVNYGTEGGSEPSQGEFYEPRRFVARLNQKLTVIDEADYENYDRLVTFDDSLDNTGWETFSANGDEGEFLFFYIVEY